MGVEQRVEELEQELRILFEQSRTIEAAELILKNIDYAYGLVDRYIPEKAQKVLGIKSRANWPGGSGCYRGENDQIVGFFEAGHDAGLDQRRLAASRQAVDDHDRIPLDEGNQQVYFFVSSKKEAGVVATERK